MPIDPNIYTFNDGDEAYIARSTAEIDRTNRMCRDGLFDGAPKPAILAGPIHTQADAEQLLPALLTCKGVAKWIGTLIEPLEEIGVSNWIPCKCSMTDHAGWNGRYISATCRRNLCEECDGNPYKQGTLDRVIVRGGEEPMHPDWVRSIRDQCEAAGVPFIFDGWGEWVAYGQSNERHAVTAWGLMSSNGKYRPFTTPWNGRQESGEECEVSVYRVGTARSGRTLDGREHRGEV